MIQIQLRIDVVRYKNFHVAACYISYRYLPQICTCKYSYLLNTTIIRQPDVVRTVLSFTAVLFRQADVVGHLKLYCCAFLGSPM